MAKFNSWSNRGRFDGLSGVATMCFAVLLSVTSITVVAQTAFEFEDPLEEMRIQIESGQPAPAIAPAGISEPLETPKYTPTADAKGPITVFAERLGLPTAGVVGLGALGLFGLLLGVMWLINRRKSVRSSKRKNSEIYAVSKGSRGRRTLESGAKVTRNRKELLDTTEQSEAGTELTSAQKAALILSDEEPDFDEYMLEEEIEAGADVNTAYAGAFGAAAAAAAGTAAFTSSEADADDPDTWKRPNLERLKASIKDDWSAKEETVDPETAKLRSEAAVFADLFGEDTPPAAVQSKAKSPVLDMLDTYEDEDNKGGTLPFTSLQSAVAKAADTAPIKQVDRGDQPSREDALRRIRALRDSVKAS